MWARVMCARVKCARVIVMLVIIIQHRVKCARVMCALCGSMCSCYGINYCSHGILVLCGHCIMCARVIIII